MKIVLIGIPGAGKSTQGNLLSKQLKIPYLSTGHIFRQIARENTQFGKSIKVILNSGLYIPDEKTIEIVNDYLSRPEYKHGYILDGFPRTTKQAEKFKNHVDKVIYIEIPDKEALWRLATRKDSDRDDNTVKAVNKRIEIFHKLTQPVLRYYEKEEKLVTIEGIKSIKEVNKEILQSLGKQLKRNQITAWKKQNKAILAITGLPGAGKSEAADYYRSKKLVVISFSSIINEYIENHKLEHTLENHTKVRTDIRKKYGMGALAVLNKDKISQALKKHDVVIIEGMRSWEEYLYLKEQFPKINNYILAVYAEKQLRYGRISRRKSRSGLRGEQRDLDELMGTNMGPTIAFADFLVKNNFSKEEFYDKLDEVYRMVYYI